MQDNINKYCTPLIEEAADMLVAKWKTGHFPLPHDMRAPCMRIIQLPKLKNYPIPDEQQVNSTFFHYTLLKLFIIC